MCVCVCVCVCSNTNMLGYTIFRPNINKLPTLIIYSRVDIEGGKGCLIYPDSCLHQLKYQRRPSFPRMC